MTDFNRKFLNKTFKALRSMFEKRLKETYGNGTKDVYVAPVPLKTTAIILRCCLI